MQREQAMRQLDLDFLAERRNLPRLVTEPGAALLEGWSDEGVWQIILPWPEELIELDHDAVERWPEAIDRMEPSPRDSEESPDAAPFLGGWVGWISWECGAALERAEPATQQTVEPPLFFARHEAGIVIDPEGNARLFAPADRIDRFEEALRAHAASVEVAEAAGSDDGSAAAAVRSSLDDEALAVKVEEVRQLIAAGEVYQVNLTRAHHVEASVDATELWLALTSPQAPRCAAFIRHHRCTVVSASPEVFLRFDASKRIAESRPIKGTRRRSGDDAADRAALESSRKDASEHLMIVDLVRNDLGKMALPGEVTVPEFRTIRELPHLLHLESTVRASLPPTVRLSALIAALFPAGSISGAPKRAAVSFIRALEPEPRGVYTGAIGFIDHRGRVELSVAIRTAIHTRDSIRYHAGGGIVWDSDPVAETVEARDKSIAFLRFFGAG
jgi:para-aminobenzoate synthetase component I